MNKSALMALLMAVVLVVLFNLATGDMAQPVGKTREVKMTPLPGPISEIYISGTPAAVKNPADFCDVQWQGSPYYYWDNTVFGPECWAAYQDPVETGCPTPVYPFGVTEITWTVYAYDTVTFDVQPVIYDYSDPDVIGPILCEGPIHNFVLEAGGWILTLPFEDTCCVYGPYYAGVILHTDLGADRLAIVTDDGVVVPPRSDATYWNPYCQEGWLDFVDDVGIDANLQLYSGGYNADQNDCPTEQPLVIFPGVDLFETPDDSMTVESLFTSVPLPADFFGPGSDPFDGIIAMEGSPLATLPPDTLGPTDVIIQRLEPAALDDPASSDTIPIQLVALSLRSTEPITVTYYGGQNPEDWLVEICLSGVLPPPLGSMSIFRYCDSGGSFDVDIHDLALKATFNRVNPPGGSPIVIDPYRVDYRFIRNGRWSTFVPPPFSVYTVPTWVEVDTDCDGSPEYTIAPDTSNFYPGITLEPCAPGAPPPICGGKVLTLLDGPSIDHRMLPPQRTSPAVGACCLPDSSCILVDSLCCDALAGKYKGDYTACFPDPCVSCCNHDGIRGDVDYNMAVNVADLSFLVCYLFCPDASCPGYPNCLVPPCLDEANVDGAGGINVADLTYLVCYLFCPDASCPGYPNCPPPPPCP